LLGQKIVITSNFKGNDLASQIEALPFFSVTFASSRVSMLTLIFGMLLGPIAAGLMSFLGAACFVPFLFFISFMIS
jgi:hypothetical protein